MKNLEMLIAQMNTVRRLFNEPPLDLANLNAQMAQDLFQEIDMRLSPEALYADGERPRAQAARLRKIYRAAVSELQRAGFQPQKEMYHF